MQNLILDGISSLIRPGLVAMGVSRWLSEKYRTPVSVVLNARSQLRRWI